MSTLFLLRPVTIALAALTIAACGTAFAASATVEIDPPIPPLPPIPDVSAIVAQAKQIAKNAQLDDRMMLAFDEDMMGLPMSMGWLANEFGHPREIVKNAPYSAEAVTEYVQALPDGNRIVKKSTTLLARDAQGRTRQERKGEGRGGVYIYDPMENRSLVLNESSRTVTRIPRVPDFEAPVPPVPPVAPVAPVPPVTGATPAPGPGTPAVSGRREIETRDGRVIVRRSRSGDETASAEDVRVEVIRMPRGENAGAPMPPMPPLTLPLMPRGKGETKSLGTRDFEGIRAEGTMTTHTIPAGAIGNEKPIVITSERWFSPDLFIVVFAKTSDPRAGETTYRVTNLKRAEPSADLFKVPADYKARGEGRESRKS